MEITKYKNLPDMFFSKAQTCISTVAAYTNQQENRRERNQFYAVSWQELSLEVSKTAAALIDDNTKKGDKVAILSNTRIEWTIADIGIMSAGAVTTTLYHTCTPAEIKFLLNNSAAKILFVEDKKQLDKVIQVVEETTIEKIIVFDEFEASNLSLNIPVINFQEYKSIGENELNETINIVRERYESLSQDDVATIVYTSGTSGQLKGVVLTHKNILFQTHSIPNTVPIRDKNENSLLAFLTSAHIFQRIAGQWYFLSQGCPIYFCNRIELVGQYLKEAPATIILAVPLILEKLRTKVSRQIEELPKTTRNIVKVSISMAIFLKKLEFTSGNEFVRLLVVLLHKLVYQLVLKKIKDRISPSLKVIISGGAPLSQECIEFFHAIGFYLIEGYGLTETTGILCANSLNSVKYGSVGKPLTSVELKISEEDEILAKGEIIFQAYWNNIDATRDSFTEDGWFKTGDLGRIDEKGNVFIIGRKKDLIITSGGKKIAPTYIEDKLCSSPFIEQAAVFGDKKNWLCALITLQRGSIIENFKGNQEEMTQNEWEHFIRDSKVNNFIKNEMNKACEHLAEHEKVRKFLILPKSFSQEKDELTHTMKIKRRIIQKNYEKEIDSLYF
ncbi:MAG: long-chain fatty acid--CoA ligase [Candidatus Caenarcaniphilales bacterium]|nr:long-chain fatty acid--CoA ligase [Candidatus Caenarcaniphilales bacterium]